MRLPSRGRLASLHLDSGPRCSFSQIVQEISLKHSGNLQKFLLGGFLSQQISLTLSELCLRYLVESKRAIELEYFHSEKSVKDIFALFCHCLIFQGVFPVDCLSLIMTLPALCLRLYIQGIS